MPGDPTCATQVCRVGMRLASKDLRAPGRGQDKDLRVPGRGLDFSVALELEPGQEAPGGKSRAPPQMTFPQIQTVGRWA